VNIRNDQNAREIKNARKTVRCVCNRAKGTTTQHRGTHIHVLGLRKRNIPFLIVHMLIEGVQTDDTWDLTVASCALSFLFFSCDSRFFARLACEREIHSFALGLCGFSCIL